jgi:hypothetical protein
LSLNQKITTLNPKMLVFLQFFSNVEKLRPFKNRFDHQMPLKLGVILAH